jgi:hypothetical protein
MAPDEFKKKINGLYLSCDGKMTDAMVAEYLNVSIQDVKRFKKGKMPARYRRDRIVNALRGAWVHYEGQSSEMPELNAR